MKILCTDLDNTLIYSHRRDIGVDKCCVELYQGREVSYMTQKSSALLKQVRREWAVIPVTTRTCEQYARIDLHAAPFTHALVCNGGILLTEGRRDEEWREETMRLIAPARSEMDKAYRLLERDARRCFELRYIEQMLLFTKCSPVYEAAAFLKQRLDLTKVDVLHNGEKLYVIPAMLDKGTAVRRLKEKLQPQLLIAAGDSTFDLPMLLEADVSYAPEGFLKSCGAFTGKIQEMGTVFSDHYLEDCLKQLQR